MNLKLKPCFLKIKPYLFGWGFDRDVHVLARDGVDDDQRRDQSVHLHAFDHLGLGVPEIDQLEHNQGAREEALHAAVQLVFGTEVVLVQESGTLADLRALVFARLGFFLLDPSVGPGLLAIDSNIDVLLGVGSPSAIDRSDELLVLLLLLLLVLFVVDGVFGQYGLKYGWVE